MPKRRTRAPRTNALATIALTTLLSSGGLLTLPGRPVDWAPLTCVALAVPLEALALALWRRLFGKRRSAWLPYGLASVVPSLLTGFLLPHGANQWLDGKSPILVTVQVGAPARAGTFVVGQDEASGQAVSVRTPVPAQPGQVLGVPVRRGLFNWRWQPKP